MPQGRFLQPGEGPSFQWPRPSLPSLAFSEMTCALGVGGAENGSFPVFSESFHLLSKHS